jgi:SAM-dependent methyltransferase
VTDAFPRGADYDARFERLAAAGQAMHGEADLVMALLEDHRPRPASRPDLVPDRPFAVLDAGCGTGRVAIELARRGVQVSGIDVDPVMIERAREKAPMIPWSVGDLADPSSLAVRSSPNGLQGLVDLAVLAGNVMIFLSTGTERQVLANVAGAVRVGGLVVAGFQLLAGRLDVDAYDRGCRDAGLELVGRFATWDRQPFPGPDADYAVSVHRRG